MYAEIRLRFREDLPQDLTPRFEYWFQKPSVDKREVIQTTLWRDSSYIFDDVVYASTHLDLSCLFIREDVQSLTVYIEPRGRKGGLAEFKCSCNRTLDRLKGFARYLECSPLPLEVVIGAEDLRPLIHGEEVVGRAVFRHAVTDNLRTEIYIALSTLVIGLLRGFEVVNLVWASATAVLALGGFLAFRLVTVHRTIQYKDL